MDLAKEALRKLDSELGGHLVGDAVDAFLKTFEARFVAALPRGGAWPARIAAASAAGATAIAIPASAFRDTDSRGVDPSRRDAIRSTCDGEGLTLASIDLDYTAQPRFRRGALAHSDAAVRRAALALAFETVSLANELGAECVRVETDAEGFDRAFQVNYGTALQHVLDACDEINAQARGANVALSIAHAPRGSRAAGAVIGSAHAAAFVAERVNRDGGGKNTGISIDCEAGEGVAAADVYFLRVAGVPLREIGLGGPPVAAALDSWALCDALYAAIDTGFDGAFRATAAREEEATELSVEIARELFANTLRRSLLVYRDKDVLLKAQAEGGAATAVAAVARAIAGGLPIRDAARKAAPKKKTSRAGR